MALQYRYPLPTMKTTTLAWLMWVAGVLGWTFLGGALGLWELGNVTLEPGEPGTLEFLTVLFSGAFLLGLSQSWLGLFAAWTNRILGRAGAQKSSAGILLGGAGFAVTVSLVVGVLVVGADPSTASLFTWSASTTIRAFLVATLIGLAFDLALESRWIQNFARRSSDVESG